MGQYMKCQGTKGKQGRTWLKQKSAPRTRRSLQGQPQVESGSKKKLIQKKGDWEVLKNISGKEKNQNWVSENCRGEGVSHVKHQGDQERLLCEGAVQATDWKKRRYP